MDVKQNLAWLKPSEKIALEYGDASLTYNQLIDQVETLAISILNTGCQRIGLYGDNSFAWLIADLAALKAGITLVPLPMFFSDDQLTHSIDSAELELIISIRDERINNLISVKSQQALGEFTLVYTGRTGTSALAGTHKVTYTSGSTGRPKGVCLGESAMVSVASSLASIVPKREGGRHVCLIPFSTLLENVAGVYSALMNHFTVVVPPQADVGLSGSSRLQIDKMYQAILDSRATTAIMTPQLLQALVFYMSQHNLALPELEFLAVGGSILAKQTLKQAQALGLPVYEGYGLSETSSVVCCNRPGAQRDGSIGRPLPHASVKISEDGEILVTGATFNGYLGLDETVDEDGYWASGDLGRIDEDGFVYITGRKKNLIISSFGRNIAPEWVEAELTTEPSIMQAAVFGDGQAFLSAVIFSMNHEQAQAAVDRINARLPDYAQVQRVVFSPYPFSVENGLFTENGRIKRHNIGEHFSKELALIYLNQENKEVVYEH